MYIAITKLDPQGNLLWRRYISSGSSWYISITGVDIDSEDKVTFLITRFGASIINLGTIDSAGVIHFFPNSVQNTLGLTFNKALRTSNGEIVAVGMVSQTYDISSACYFRFSATGDTLATAFWPVDQGSQYYKAEAYDLALMDNGNLLVTCSLNSTSRTLLEINLNGFVVSRYDIPGEMQLYVVPICREPNSQSYLIAYRMGESPNNSIFIDRFENGVFEPLFTIPTSYLSFVSSMILGTDAIYLCGTFGINASLVSLSYAGVVNWSRNQQGSNVCDYINAGFGSYSTALLGIDDAGCVYWAWGNVGEQVI
ncbi:MAG: hypothetical protein U1C33_04075, partial [Candidatus Cloacimonadaceae bacterium]|nr:hypothetical protein [Candidatus Cloacimonadaceae bacterium]